MIIGVPREIHRHEHRVGLNPFAVARLVQAGHSVLVERGAGDAARFGDRDYQESGARIAYDSEEVYGRADLVCRVGRLSRDELEQLKSGTVLCAFQHLAVAPRSDVERLIELRATAVGYELIRDLHGEHPVLNPLSEMGGRMSVQIAGHYLQVESGGRGVLLGNVPGVPPPTVLILGAGVVGRAAAAQALASGAHVIVLDEDVAKLTALNRQFADRAVTVLAATERLEQYTPFADVLIGAVQVPGERAPFVVTEKMVRAMKAGSVIIDVSIDLGGCIETSRPTTLESPTFKVHGVLHYCVPNMTSNVARTASRALANVAIPYVLRLAGGLDEAIAADEGLAEGLLLYRGRVVNPQLARMLGLEFHELQSSLGKEP